MPSFSGVTKRTLDGSQAGLGRDRPRRPSRRGAERPGGADRRRRLRQSRDLRRADRHAQLHADRGRGRPLQPLPRPRALLADAGGAAHRPQQPRGRLRLRRRVLDRVPRLHGVRPGRLRAVPEDPAGQRVQHRRLRQVAPDAGRPAGPGRAVQPLARRLGVRLLLRVPRRGLGPVGSVPGREPEDHRHSRRLLRRGRRGSVLPARRHGGQDDRVAARDPGAGRRTSRSSPTSPPAAATPRITSPRSGRRSTRASSTRAGTSCARRPSPGRRSSGSSRRTPSSPNATMRSRPGRTSPTSSRRSTRARWRSTPATPRTPTTTSAG